MEHNFNNRKSFKDSDCYKKAWGIMILVDKIVAAVENTDIDFTEGDYQREWIKESLNYLKANSQLIPAKIAGAYGNTFYDIKMENAAIIRKAARALITDARGLQINGYKETEYLDLLRTEVEEFRILFAEWVKTFDIENFIIDRWGLFNPPGVNYDDHDPDDDIPFDPAEFMKFMEGEDDDEGEEWKKGLDSTDDDDLS